MNRLIHTYSSSDGNNEDGDPTGEGRPVGDPRPPGDDGAIGGVD